MTTLSPPYLGRFAPSPTGPLHAGSLVAALASWLDARAHGGKWLVRIEDIDTPRCVDGADRIILGQLAACGLHSDEPPVYQSQRGPLYQQALDQLTAQGRAFPCGCSRQDIASALAALGAFSSRNSDTVYPGTCRDGLHGKKPLSWRFQTAFSPSNSATAQSKRLLHATNTVADTILTWSDRQLGLQTQNVSQAVGDFVLKRSDGLWAYQLAVVVDDAAQGITHIVRGQDLVDNTARQILLQRALGLPQPQYLHTPLVLGANGEKLSKQNGAVAFNSVDPLQALRAAGVTLGLLIDHKSVTEWLACAVADWRRRF